MKFVRASVGILFALSTFAIATAVASGSPDVLVSFGVGFEIEGGASTFTSKNGLEVKCTSEQGSGEVTSARLGTFTITYSGCTGALGAKCTGLSNTTAGQTTVSGIWHWWALLPGPVGGFVYLLNEVHFTCGGVLSVVRGCVAGPGTPTNVSTETVENTLNQTKGVNEFTLVENESGATVTCILETSTAGGKFEQSGHKNKKKFHFPGIKIELMF